MAGFIFDPSKGETPESLRRRRDIANALLAGRTAPRNVGEGLSELGNALAYRAVMGKVRKGEEYGQEQEADARAALLAALGGGGGAQAPAPAAASPAAPMAPQAASQGGPTVDQMTSYIQQAAQSRSIDPQTAVRVAKAEGLQPGVWQSNVMNDGQREQSYGPFQLYMGGGLGNEFQQQTGLDPRDQSTWRQQIDFSLDKAKQGGWGPWNGAKAIGLDQWAGLKQPGGQSLRDGVRAAYATLNPSSAQPTQQAQQGGVSLPQLIEIAQNPWADETTKGIAMSLIQQQLAQAKPETTDDIREYNFAKQQGYQGSLQDWITSGRKAGATTVNVGQGSSEYNKALDKNFADQYIAIQGGAQSARSKLATLQGLGSALDQSGYTGFGAETVLAMKQAGRALGIDIGEDLGPQETARALGNQLALQLRSPSSGAGMPGAMSDKDREFLVSSVPGLTKTPSGNRRLIDYMTKVEQRNIEVARLAQEYASRQGQIDNGFYQYLAKWSEANPLFSDADRPPPAGEQDNKGAPEGIEPALWEVMTPEERALWQN